MGSHEPKPSDPAATGKLDDPWGASAKATDADFDDCEMCKAGLTAIMPAGPVVALPDGSYPPNLPGTPDSNDDEPSVGAHGLAVTRWESSEEELPGDDGTRAETDSLELQASPTTAAAAVAAAAAAPSPSHASPRVTECNDLMLSQQL